MHGLHVRSERLATVLLAVVGLVCAATALAQPRPPRDPIYGTMPPAAPSAVDAPSQSAEERARAAEHRARVAARVGEVVVTVGEIEDHLRSASATERASFQTTDGRREVVERLLRRHLLALEAERRGVLDAMARRALDRRVDSRLRDLLEEDVRRDPGPVPAASAPVDIPETRFAVILRTDSRQTAQRWAAESERVGYLVVLAQANELGQGQETPWGTRGEPPEATPAIEPALWRQLFEMDAESHASGPIAIGAGRFGVVFFAGRSGGYTDTGPDESARRMLAGDRAWAELAARVRTERVRDFDPSVVDGVPFRMAPGRSREAMQALAREVEHVQAAQRAEGIRQQAEQEQADQARDEAHEEAAPEQRR